MDFININVENIIENQPILNKEIGEQNNTSQENIDLTKEK
jgi:hypothetical protein